MSTKAGGTDHLFLFTYANWLLITCGFRFNINYVFVYLFKAMSTKAGGTTTCFYLFMEIDCWFNVFFISIFIITARKCSLRRLCFYTCLSLILFTGAYPSMPPPDEEPPCMENGEPPAPVWRIETPPMENPPTMENPPDVEPPQYWQPPQPDNKQVVRILLECILVYLLIYSKRCQQNQLETNTFIYLWKSLVDLMWFSF